jgi:hypothetical protein
MGKNVEDDENYILRPLNFIKINNDIKDDVNNYSAKRRELYCLPFKRERKGFFHHPKKLLLSRAANLFSFDSRLP